MESNITDNRATDQTDDIGSAVSRVIHTVKSILRKDARADESEPVVWDESDEYDFTHPNRGSMIIFNMEHFKTKDGNRDGSSIDVENLTTTFTNLGFSVSCYNDLSRKKMRTALKEASKIDHRNSDCFVCFILSHGGEEHLPVKKRPGHHERVEFVFSADDDILTTQEIVGFFTEKNCKSLVGKPKLFFIQACRGKSFDSGTDLNVAYDEVDSCKEDVILTTPWPIHKDFLIMYATPPGFYAFRRDGVGSWFVLALCHVLSQRKARHLSLTTLLTMVTKLVCQNFESAGSDEETTGNKQTPCFMSMLLKDVYFRTKQKSAII